MEQCRQHHATQSESNHEDIDKLKIGSGGGTGSENNSGGFDCNICLDFVQDPVVTFCGHLYCWPCIYRWLHSQENSLEDPYQQPQCPVCKADVTQSTLIPLYGRTQSGKPSDSTGTQIGLVIPQRPNSCGVDTLVAGTPTSSRPHSLPSEQLHHHHEVHPYYTLGDNFPSPAFGFAGTTTFHPMIGMFGEMIYGRFFRNSQATLYTYPNTYRNVSIATSGGRVRRHVMQADRSLSRVSFFLFCCILLCLLLF